MITKITLKNFKCFKEKTHFPLSKMNLLTGVNGGGKSSMLQALLLFKQSSKINLGHDNKLYLNGDVVDLGTLQDVKNSETAIGLPIEIDLEYDKIELSHRRQQSGRYSFQYATTNFATDEASISVDIQDRHLNELFATFYAKDSVDKQEEGEPIAPMVYKFLISGPIHYIGADRVGPQNVYSYGNPDYFLKVDKQGKYAPYVLYDKRNDIVHKVLCLGQEAPTALQQTEAWLNEIFEGAKVELKPEDDKISMSYNTKNTPNRYKPSNVGFGYSYILPIIVSGLIAKKEDILIVENPEAHLHPKAQSKLTKFLAKVASCGVQVFIETHSEHILNALRVVSVSEDYEIKNTDISILYFQNDDNQLVIPIPIQENGGIEVWPDGFFDQTDKDFKILFGF